MNSRATARFALLCYVNTVYTITHGTHGISLNNNSDSEVIERVWRTDGLIRRDYSSRFRLSSNIHDVSRAGSSVRTTPSLWTISIICDPPF